MEQDAVWAEDAIAMAGRRWEDTKVRKLLEDNQDGGGLEFGRRGVKSLRSDNLRGRNHFTNPGI